MTEGIAEAVEAIRVRTDLAPEVGVVLGSGLGGFADAVEEAVEIAYDEIPGWPTSTAVGHAGRLVAGRFGGRPIAVMKGRAHLYEGLAPDRVVFGVRVLAALGVRPSFSPTRVGRSTRRSSQGSSSRSPITSTCRPPRP